MYKINKIVYFLFIIFTFTSCNIENKEENTEENSLFKEQILSGKILDEEYVFDYGCEVFLPTDIGLKRHLFLYSTNYANSSFPVLSFQLEDLELKKYNIKNYRSHGVDLCGFVSQIPSFFDDGEVEILSIDELGITGRVWANNNEGTSSVNGNFTVLFENSI